MTALSDKNYSGHRKATEVDGDQRTAGKELKRETWTTGETWKGQSWMKTSGVWPILHLLLSSYARSHMLSAS